MKSAIVHPVFAAPATASPVSAFAVAPASHDASQDSITQVTQLVRRDSSGRVAQRWVLNQTKNMLGSSDQCTIQCSVPGIEPQNLLIVQGVRQTFLRALVPNLTRDGVPVNELLLSEDQNQFEVAGHPFELVRHESGRKRPAMPETDGRQSSRLSFALSRPSNIASPTSNANPRYANGGEQAQMANAVWLKNLIQRTIEPLEEQIESLLVPVTEFQTQVLESQSQVIESFDAHKEFAIAEHKKQSEFAGEITATIARQASTIETLGERLKDIDHQLGTLERIIAKEGQSSSEDKAKFGRDITAHQAALEQLQIGLAAVAQSVSQIDHRQESARVEDGRWRDELKEQLEQLAELVSQVDQRLGKPQDGKVLSTVQSIQQHQQQIQQEIQKLQADVRDQLGELEQQLTGQAEALQEDFVRRIEELPKSIQVTSSNGFSAPGNYAPSGFRNSESNNPQPQAESTGNSELDSEWLDQWTAPPAVAFSDAFTEGAVSDVVDLTNATEVVEFKPSTEGDLFLELEAPAFETQDENRNQSSTTNLSGAESDASEEALFTSPIAAPSNLPSWWDENDSAEATGIENADLQIEAEESSPLDVQIPNESSEDVVGSSPWPEPDPPEEASEVARETLGPFSVGHNDNEPGVVVSTGMLVEGINESLGEPKPGDGANLGDESVEDYMRNLLARMRGESAPPVGTTLGASPASPPAGNSVGTAHSTICVVENGLEPAELIQPTQAIDMESFVSLTNAPEKSKNISAMRELANSSARSAIQQSTRQRYLSGSLMKLAVSTIGFTIAGVLIAINGFALNVGLVATLASLMVALIWGYDGVTSLRPILQAGLVPAPSHDETGHATLKSESADPFTKPPKEESVRTRG